MKSYIVFFLCHVLLFLLSGSCHYDTLIQTSDHQESKIDSFSSRTAPFFGMNIDVNRVDCHGQKGANIPNVTQINELKLTWLRQESNFFRPHDLIDAGNSGSDYLKAMDVWAERFIPLLKLIDSVNNSPLRKNGTLAPLRLLLVIHSDFYYFPKAMMHLIHNRNLGANIGSDLIAWQIGNEPDIPYEGAPAATHPAVYAEVLQRGYKKIRDAYTELALAYPKIVTAGLGKTSANPSPGEDLMASLDQKLYLKKVIEANQGQRYFDAVALHFYGVRVDNYNEHPFGLPNSYSITEIIDAHRTLIGSQVPIWITEIGIHAGPNPNPQEVAAGTRFISSVFNFFTSSAGSLNINNFFWFGWHDVVGHGEFGIADACNRTNRWQYQAIKNHKDKFRAH
ncbi:MAG: hypothetical protein KBD78_17200 [Oligoflexales bacterium]|nr:hypothetical protein [Oligoflexales bacterium]